MTNKGKIAQIIGPVVDIEFKILPKIYSALEVKNENKKLVLEAEQHLGGNLVRAVALGPTDGLKRSQEVEDMGRPISVPVGKETLGRLINVYGEFIDNLGFVKTKKTYPIHREPPPLSQQETKSEVFET